MWALIPEKFHRLRLSHFISPLRSPSLSRSLDFCSVFPVSRLKNWTCCGQCSKNVFISTCQEIYVQMHWTSHHSTNIKNSGIASWNEIPESGKFLPLESGILDFGIRNTTQRIRNPFNDWNPESKSHWERIQNRVPGIWNPRRGIQNPNVSWIPLHWATGTFSSVPPPQPPPPGVQWPSNCLSRNPFVTSQGSYRPWKSWKVMEFKNFMFKSWKVMEFQLSVLDSHGKLKFCLVD